MENNRGERESSYASSNVKRSNMMITVFGEDIDSLCKRIHDQENELGIAPRKEIKKMAQGYLCYMHYE